MRSATTLDGTRRQPRPGALAPGSLIAARGPLAAGCLLGMTLPCCALGAPPSHPMPVLDLRAPPATPAMPTTLGLRAGGVGRGTRSAVEDSQLPVLGATAVLRMQGKLEIFARRVHREGLPLVRLWEGHSALVSLGLSPKGKPGLWLIQKVP